MLEKLPDAMGEALGDIRAGLTKTVFNGVDLRTGMGQIVVSSSAFADHAPMPGKYTADGSGLSPPLHWSGVPAAATEVALIVEDADSPTPQPFVHAIAYGLPTGDEDDGALAEGTLSALGEARPLVPMGRNSLLQARWLPPDPPPGHGSHRYVVQIFALGPGASLPEAPGRDALRHAVCERGLASGCLIGTYERPSGSIPDPRPLADKAAATAAGAAGAAGT
jgi:phosphatidylethanolamine-binding protein (PEBP) family uncharacterized protein